MNGKRRRPRGSLLTGFSIAVVIFCGSEAVALSPMDSVVRFDTTLGQFDVELFNSTAPITVANFLNYVATGRYQDSLIHRSVPGFVIQGGGYYVSDDGVGTHVTPVPTFPPIVNEFGLHNVRGTLAMAKLPSNPNSATGQWFLNLVD